LVAMGSYFLSGHDMDFRHGYVKLQVYIWDLSSYWLAQLWSQWEWLFTLVYTRYGFLLWPFQNTGLWDLSSYLASTIMVAMGLTLYHGMHIHDMDFRCGVAKKSDSYMSFIILGWNHCGQNWIDS
jgi:hypothetical protein